ncbi:NAD(P)-dependent oxidoreductase [Cerasicoccus maritimus]|uniref:NAD(P)-dependent oxidoreductase n=1 Tax=Cerasicoccus maritimus TaxID=490089 RepID=UPI0028524A44|nr:NAD(P)-dependent oxidoreductase [Cerasicoccus maritimus]
MKIWKNTATLDPYTSLTKATVEAAEAEIAVVGSRPFDLDAMPQVKGVFKCGVGMDNMPMAALAERGIAVGLPSEQTRGYIFEETANYAVHLTLRMLYANVGDLYGWKKAPRDFLGDRPVLVVGAGNIGGHVARKLERLCRVVTYDAATDPPEKLWQLLPQADVVTLHIPSTAETRGFVGAKFLAAMHDGAALVNTARGPIVDEDALFEELTAGRLRAAFDVFWQEPYAGKLKALHPDPFFMSPHVASANETFLRGLASDFETFLTKIQ